MGAIPTTTNKGKQMPDTGPDKIHPAGLMRCCIARWRARPHNFRLTQMHCDVCGERLVRDHDGVRRWAGAADGQS